MSYINCKYLMRTVLVIIFCFGLTGCERELTEEAEFATFSTNGDVFIDGFSSGLDYFPFVDAGADPEAFSVETNDNDVFEGDAAMRFDVPAFGNGFLGAAFNSSGSRDLTGYDALTFYAKASQAAKIDAIGFGINGTTNNKYQVTLNGLGVSTNWKKYVIPIPDPSKLFAESGLFWLAEGASFEGDEGGYTLWLDEIKFEKLGTVAQPNPAIFSGEDIEVQSFKGSTINVTGLTQTFNLDSGINRTVLAAPSYFTFKSSNTSVAVVNEIGVVSVIGQGTATITAMIGGVRASGSVVITAASGFDFAPIPPARESEDVISIFSDAYNNVPVDYYNGFFSDGFQTTEGGAPPLDFNGDAIINYTMLNFVGIGTFQDVQSIDVTAMTHLHIDIKANEAVNPSDFISVELLNSVGSNETSGTVRFDATNFEQDVWTSLDIPIADFGLGDVSQIGLLFFISDTTISDIFVDNIYYYRE